MLLPDAIRFIHANCKNATVLSHSIKIGVLSHSSGGDANPSYSIILSLYLHSPSMTFFSISVPFSAAVHFWLKAVVPK